jgi:hypothetical protein
MELKLMELHAFDKDRTKSGQIQTEDLEEKSVVFY